MEREYFSGERALEAGKYRIYNEDGASTGRIIVIDNRGDKFPRTPWPGQYYKKV